MKSPFTVTSVLVMTLAVTGCANLLPQQIGATQNAVRAALGPPTLMMKTGSGERWAYSSAPEGKLTWLYDFDASGRVVSRIQALTIERMSMVKNGQTQAEVESLIGPSYWTLRYPLKREELVHVYRFDDKALPMCFYVAYGTANTVVDIGMQEEIRSAFRSPRPC